MTFSYGCFNPLTASCTCPRLAKPGIHDETNGLDIACQDKDITVINLNPVTVENFFRSICATSDLNFKIVENLGIHCLTTLTYSDAFMQGYNAEWQQIFKNITNSSAIIAKTGSEISDIITSGYEERQSTYDIISQKQSDATMGYERVYDTETGEIYKAYNGFTDDISTDNYLSERYQTVTDNMYLEGIDGYIEK